MDPVRLCTVLLLTAAMLGFGKSDVDNATVCDRYKRSDLIFTGSAETPWITTVDTRKSPIHKRSEKSKRVRFLVREWFKGTRRNTVEVWMAPADCDLRIAANRTFLVYARMNKDNGRIESNACSGAIPVDKAASDIPYLTAAQLGPDQSSRLYGNAGTEGVYVQAKSGIDTRYGVSDSSGAFTIEGLPTGDWQVSVKGGAPKAAHLEPGSCLEVDLK